MYVTKENQNKTNPVYDILAKQARQAKCMEANFQIQFRWNKSISLPNHPFLLPSVLSLPSMFACFAIHSYLLFYTSEQNILLAKFPWLYKILLVLPGWGNSTFMKAINEKNEFYIAFNKIAATLLGYLLMDGMVGSFHVLFDKNIYWIWSVLYKTFLSLLNENFSVSYKSVS